MSDSSDGPIFRTAAERIMYNKRRKFESKHHDLIEALTAGGHKPTVRVMWHRGEGGGARVSLVCEKCSARRRSWLPERWQQLSPDKTCAL